MISQNKIIKKRKFWLKFQLAWFQIYKTFFIHKEYEIIVCTSLVCQITQMKRYLYNLPPQPKLQANIIQETLKAQIIF